MIRYKVSWLDPNTHLYDVTIEFQALTDETRLLLPSWRPGRYLIQNYAADVRQWSGNMRKVAKSVWAVEAEPGQAVRVSYRFFAGVLDAGSSFLDEREAYFNGSNLFMMIQGRREEACTLEVAVPPDWTLETQLPSRGTVCCARDYDHLIDSPLLASGSLTVRSVTTAGAEVRLVFRDAGEIDTEQLVEPVASIVREQAALFGALPLTQYRFLYQLGMMWHGVEHEDSTSIILKRSAMIGAGSESEGHDEFLSISSHEFFHLWLVKRILPAVFAPYDYMNETPTRLLWVMEGVTSYFGDLTLVRAGLWSVDRYLKHLAVEVAALENAPGRHHLSLAQASFDGWLQSDMHDRPNAWISFYNKGELVALMLDLALRANAETSLDEVLRDLWKGRDSSGRALLAEDGFEAAVCARWPGGRDFFRRYVDGTEALPYEELLHQAGLSIVTTRSDSPSLGATFRVASGTLKIETVRAGGPLAIAGLLPGDEIIAIGDERVSTEADVARVLRNMTVDCDLALLWSRGGVISRSPMTAACDDRVRIRIEVAGESSVRDAWLRSLCD